MFSYILKRLLEAIPVLWIIATCTFFLIHMAPGGPFDSERNLSKEAEAHITAYYNLDKPLISQYKNYLWNLAHGDMGPSLKYSGRRVQDIILEKLPTSIELAAWSFTFAMTLGLTLGFISGLKPGTPLDWITSSFSMLGICMPSFILAPILILLFAIKFKWVQVSGWYTVSDRVLPAITLGAFFSAYIAKLARNSTLEIIHQNYIQTAKAKGVSPLKIVTTHILRNAIQPIISYAGPALAALMTGSFIIETIFNIPGLGYFFITATFNRDYTLILGMALTYATMLILFNIVVDVLLAWCNPKLKLVS